MKFSRFPEGFSPSHFLFAEFFCEIPTLFQKNFLCRFQKTKKRPLHLFSKIGVVRTILTLILLTAKIINEMLRLVQSIFRQIRAVDDLKALGRWVKLGDKTVRNGVVFAFQSRV